MRIATAVALCLLIGCCDPEQDRVWCVCCPVAEDQCTQEKQCSCCYCRDYPYED